MKRRALIGAVVTLLLLSLSISDGLCQMGPLGPPLLFSPPIPIVGYANYKHNPFVGTKLVFHIILTSVYLTNLYGVTQVTAINTDPYLDPNIYTFSLTPYTQSLTLDWVAFGEFDNQSGIYTVTIEREKSGWDNATLTSNGMPEGVVPFPTPENLRVSFESGLETPTLSFDPIPGFDANGTTRLYRIRIYDEDYTRLIYVHNSAIPQVTFPVGRNISAPPDPGCNNSTGEDLIPGKRYIFRADVAEVLSGGPNFNIASSFVTFKVPKK